VIQLLKVDEIWCEMAVLTCYLVEENLVLQLAILVAQNINRLSCDNKHAMPLLVAVSIIFCHQA